MRDLVVLFIHFIAALARLLGPGGARSIVAESILLRHQLLIVNRSRHRSPNLCASDRILAGLMALLVRPTRLVRSAIVLKPSTLLGLHKALSKQKYRMLFSLNRRRKPGPKGPSAELIDAVVDMKQRNPRWGCPRIAQQIALAFHIPIDKDVVRRILAHHHWPGQDSGGPSWLTFLGHVKDSLWSMDLFTRVGDVADPLGPGPYGPIHATDHWLRRPCRRGRWCRTLSNVQPRHSRATLATEVPQLRQRSSL
jgi:putative transposase